METHDRSRVVSFFFLAVALSVLGFFVPHWLGMEEGDLLKSFVQIFLYSWGPGLAVMLLTQFQEGRSLQHYGWTRKTLTFRSLATSIFAPLGIVLAVLLSVFLLGNLFHLPGFGEVIMIDQGGLAELSQFVQHHFDIRTTPGVMMPSEYWTIIGLVLVFGTIAGATLNLFFNLGEELGFRGFMVRETRDLGFMGSNFIIGIMQGVWTLPLIYMTFPAEMGGVNFGVILSTIGYFVAISFPLAYMNLKSHSIYPSAIFNGVFNNISILTFFFIWGEDPLLASPKGLAGMLVFLLITYLILRRDPDFVEDYPELGFVEETEIPIDEEEPPFEE